MSENSQDGDAGAASVLDGWLTREALARELSVSEKTLKRWDSERTGPPFAQLGKRKLYNRDQVRAWLEARVVSPRASRSARAAG